MDFGDELCVILVVDDDNDDIDDDDDDTKDSLLVVSRVVERRLLYSSMDIFLQTPYCNTPKLTAAIERNQTISKDVGECLLKEKQLHLPAVLL
jgi:hypothetical protein